MTHSTVLWVEWLKVTGFLGLEPCRTRPSAGTGGWAAMAGTDRARARTPADNRANFMTTSSQASRTLGRAERLRDVTDR